MWNRVQVKEVGGGGAGGPGRTHRHHQQQRQQPVRRRWSSASECEASVSANEQASPPGPAPLPPPPPSPPSCRPASATTLPQPPLQLATPTTVLASSGARALPSVASSFLFATVLWITRLASPTRRPPPGKAFPSSATTRPALWPFVLSLFCSWCFYICCGGSLYRVVPAGPRGGRARCCHLLLHLLVLEGWRARPGRASGWHHYSGLTRRACGQRMNEFILSLLMTALSS